MRDEQPMRHITINGKAIGPGAPTYIVAEIGFNHGGDVELAVRMIEAAAGAGVDAVKFQTYRASGLVLESSEHFDIIRDGELSLEAHERLADMARRCGVDFLSTPFGADCVDLLEKVGAPAYKVASMDLTNTPLLGKIAALGKPMIVSTGMATPGEIADAVETVLRSGNEQIVLLHCISKYPTLPGDANLRIISVLGELFDFPVGYSDHTVGNAAALAAVTLGARLIEKHFTISKDLPGPDHKISSSPSEMAQLVRDVRTVEASLGSREAIFNRPDRDNAALFRRGLFACVDIPKGTVLAEEMIRCVRPAAGLEPGDIGRVVGRKAGVDIGKDQPITWDDL